MIRIIDRILTTTRRGYRVKGEIPQALHNELLAFIETLESLEEEQDKAILESIPEDKAHLFKSKYPYWEPGEEYTPGDIRRWPIDGVDKLYTTLQAHTSQPGWEPHVAHSLWRDLEGEIPGDDGYPTWAPSGQYQLGNIVRHNDTLWESTHEGINVWEPGTVDDRIWRAYEQN